MLAKYEEVCNYYMLEDSNLGEQMADLLKKKVQERTQELENMLTSQI